MVCRRMVLCKIVHQIGVSWSPVHSKLTLCFAVTEPVKVHVHCFCSFWLNFIIDHAFHCHVVCLDWGAELWMSHFHEYLFKNSAPNSASAAKAMTALMIVAFVKMAPLLGGNLSSFDRKNVRQHGFVHSFCCSTLHCCVHRESFCWLCM